MTLYGTEDILTKDIGRNSNAGASLPPRPSSQPGSYTTVQRAIDPRGPPPPLSENSFGRQPRTEAQNREAYRSDYEERHSAIFAQAERAERDRKLAQQREREQREQREQREFQDMRDLHEQQKNREHRVRNQCLLNVLEPFN